MKRHRTYYLLIALILVSACKNFDWQGSRKQATEPPSTQLKSAAQAPTYSPVQGLFNTTPSVTISSATAGAVICYTTNGTQPDCDAAQTGCASGTAFTATPITISSSLTLKSIACKPDYVNSGITSGAYTIDLTATASASAFIATAGDTEVALAWQNPADADFNRVKVLRKTGSFPANSSDGVSVYEGNGTSFADQGLSNGTAYYYAIFAYDLAGNESAVTTASATPMGGLVNAPTFSPLPGIFNAAQSTVLTTTTVGSIICYTTDNSNPTCTTTPTCSGTGTQYTTPVNMPATTTLKAIACKSGSTDSGIASGTYTIDTIPPVFSATLPAANSFVNSALLSYTLSETCTTGSITWTQTSGPTDAASPHVQPLSPSEMAAGAHNDITLANNPVLTEGAVYTISFNCTDAAGNAATTMSIANIKFDSMPPGNVVGFRAIAGNARITLVWTNPADADLTGVRVVRKTGSYPTGISDGTIVFDAAGSFTTDNTLSNGTQYYYRAFAQDANPNFATGVTASTTPVLPCGGGNCRIFVTTATSDGNLGGIAGADARCNADVGKPNASLYKAILSDSGTRRSCLAANCSGATGVEQSLDWPLYPSVNYVRADGSTLIGASSTAAILPIPSLTASVQTGAATQVWTGLDNWLPHANTCLGWTDNAPAANLGATGVANSGTTATAFWNTTGNCNLNRPLYCAEQ